MSWNKGPNVSIIKIAILEVTDSMLLWISSRKQNWECVPMPTAMKIISCRSLPRWAPVAFSSLSLDGAAWAAAVSHRGAVRRPQATFSMAAKGFGTMDVNVRPPPQLKASRPARNMSSMRKYTGKPLDDRQILLFGMVMAPQHVLTGWEGLS